MTTEENANAALRAAFDKVTEEKRKAADEARMKKVEEQRHEAWTDAEQDGAMYQQYADELAARVTALQARISAGEKDLDDDLAKLSAAQTMAAGMVTKAGEIFGSLKAEKAQRVEEEAKNADGKALKEAESQLTQFAKKKDQLLKQQKDITDAMAKTKSQTKLAKFQEDLAKLTADMGELDATKAKVETEIGKKKAAKASEETKLAEADAALITSLTEE